MPDELEKSGGDKTEEEGESDRPTVSPPFDPATFARDAKLARPSPARGTSAVPHDAHTHATPPQGTAQQAAAAELSRPSTPPVRERKTADGSSPLDHPEAAPDSIRSIAAKRLPSHEMPRIDVPKRPDSLSSLNAVDSGWGAEAETRAVSDVATRPPPADAPDEDPIIEVSTDRTVSLEDLDDIDLGDSTPPVSAEPTAPSEPPAKAASVPTKTPTEREMNDRVSVGDYSGALEIAEKLLADDPHNATIKACADNCRAVLKQMYATRIGPLHRVPTVAVARDQLRWLSIDHKAGFVLSLVDGVSSLEMIIDVSGMPQLDTLRILSELVQQRIISLR
ncbi:MAG: hypothetical protein KIT84_38235 [Labilithrix sp.]|nr:hypothetical protein [Labilithrix sp.]